MRKRKNDSSLNGDVTINFDNDLHEIPKKVSYRRSEDPSRGGSRFLKQVDLFPSVPMAILTYE